MTQHSPLGLGHVSGCPQPVPGTGVHGRARAASPCRRPGLTACPLCSRRTNYSAHAAYAQSKLALVLFTYRLQALLIARGAPVTASVADPGVVDTDLYRHVFWGTRLVKKLLGWWVFKVKAAMLGALLRAAGRSGFNFLDAAVLPIPGSTSSFSVPLLTDIEVASVSLLLRLSDVMNAGVHVSFPMIICSRCMPQQWDHRIV